jgi:hypothetical protein
MNYFFSIPTALAALVMAASTFAASVILTSQPSAAIYVTPSTTSVEVGDMVTILVLVKSNVPVNAFTSELIFDTARFEVKDISYNTSIADLWVEEPWYNRASNSIYFAGGTTKKDGFTGTGELMQVTLQAKAVGDTQLNLRNTRVLAHDGLGIDVPLTKPLDTFFTIDTTPFATPLQEIKTESIVVISERPTLDVNGDGTLSFKDIGVLLSSIGSDDARYDFNGDGSVSWSDIRTWQKLRGLE